MGRHKGDQSSKEAKEYARELTKLLGTTYKYNFDMERAVELLLCHRVAEKLLEYGEDVDLVDREVTVEIPLLGDLTITPEVFHEKHRLTEKPSMHLDFQFKPLSGFKNDLLRLFAENSSPLQKELADEYGSRLKEMYARIREDENS